MAIKFESRVARHFRTSGFRLAVQGAFISICGALIVFTVVYHATRATVLSALDDTVANEREDVLSRALLYNANLHDMRQAMQQSIQVAMQRSKGTFYALCTRDNVVVTGNLEVSSKISKLWHGWRTVRRTDGISLPPYVTAIRGLSIALANGDTLYIAENASSYYALNHLIGRIFLIIFGPILVLSILGGLLVARTTLNRVSLIASISREIVSGDLSRRLPTSGSRDEFDELADVLNTMLNRIETLVENIKQVSNDISHDLRSPLARLRERLELARQNMHRTAIADLIDEAIVQADTTLALFSAMLRISEIEAGTRKSSFRHIKLSELLLDLIATYDAVTELDGKTMLSSVESGLQIEGDSELLCQMFVNIVENAIRHCPHGTTIFVKAERTTDGHINVIIADNGYGIPEDQRARVFQRFVRLDASRQRPGSGLGLALVAAIATMHNYSIRLEDNNPGLKVIVTMQ